ncbi:type II toxin-antitoxin system RelE/ParE family toxin [Aequorivita viscosa]|nr:type II toxin-antitoxin system RelE/ParE family toxin [Aequorivita viscosa]
MIVTKKTSEFDKWIRKLKDIRAKSKILFRIQKLETDGHFGDCKPVGEGISLDRQKLSNASKKFKSILNTICGYDMDIEEGRKDIEHENGNALGTFWAALCLDDLLRTRSFIRGIDKAI